MAEKYGRREGEKQLTAGERAINWSKALMTSWPIILFLIGGTAYNAPAVKKLVHGAPPPTVEDVQPPEKPEYYRKSIEDIITKIKQIQTDVDAVKSHSDVKDRNNYRALQKDIQELRSQVEAIKLLVN